MELNKVAIIGAGAIGSYFIAGLSEKLGDNLWIVAEGERAKRLAANGIIINEKRYTLNVKTAQEAAGADLLIVAVKYGSLRECLPSIGQIVAAHTLVISPLNGVDSESVIGERIGMELVFVYEDCVAASRQRDKVQPRRNARSVFRGNKRGADAAHSCIGKPTNWNRCSLSNQQKYRTGYLVQICAQHQQKHSAGNHQLRLRGIHGQHAFGIYQRQAARRSGKGGGKEGN